MPMVVVLPPKVVSTLSQQARKATRSNDLQMIVVPSKTGLRKAERPNGKAQCATQRAQVIRRPCAPRIASADLRLLFHCLRWGSCVAGPDANDHQGGTARRGLHWRALCCTGARTVLHWRALHR